jgi:hypothetical protein
MHRKSRNIPTNRKLIRTSLVRIRALLSEMGIRGETEVGPWPNEKEKRARRRFTMYNIRCTIYNVQYTRAYKPGKEEERIIERVGNRKKHSFAV